VIIDDVRRSFRLGLIALVAAVIVSAASATESTIDPGVGIGKIKLGMTLPQVERVLGKDYLINTETLVDNARFRELAWNFASWTVGFLRRGHDWRVVQVETTLSPQRTRKSIGVSSPFKQVVARYPRVFCNGIYSTWGTDYTRHWDTALILADKSVYTAFAVKPSVYAHAKVPWRVYAVIVQQAVPGHTSLTPPSYRCSPGWRTRGRP
jgi:hypothetical protein